MVFVYLDFETLSRLCYSAYLKLRLSVLLDQKLYSWSSKIEIIASLRITIFFRIFNVTFQFWLKRLNSWRRQHSAAMILRFIAIWFITRPIDHWRLRRATADIFFAFIRIHRILFSESIDRLIWVNVIGFAC